MPDVLTTALGGELDLLADCTGIYYPPQVTVLAGRATTSTKTGTANLPTGTSV